ncbi:Eco57I restriction-modification methylase domain-containing protein [uncultured Alistipes sp.]|nr:Eco57I restriction-modification methylase domain-containing protein [uncultured Alistipes sp.]
MAKTKNKYGQYFTSASIAEYMVTLITHDVSAKVLEPSCGEGVFLGMLEKHGFGNITAYEIDPTLDNPYEYVDYRSFVSSPEDENFDVIIGNPPYIRWRNLEEHLKAELAQSRLWSLYFNSMCDYFFIFILKSIEQLNDAGELIFICPEYWMNTTHSESLRDYMVAHGSLTDIYHFKEVPLFEGVASSFVIFRYVKSVAVASMNVWRYAGKKRPTTEGLQKASSFVLTTVPQFEPGERWIFATSEERLSMISFERSCRKRCLPVASSGDYYRIGDFCDIGNGMVSGLDKAFRIEDVSLLNERERDALIHVYKAKDLRCFRNVSDSYYFFVKEDIDEETFANRYPNVYSRLIPYRDELSKRYSYGKELKMWEFAFPRNEALFRRPEYRIFVPCKERISNKNHFRFAIADPETFPLQDVTGILKKSNCRESIYYLLAYLNSSRVFEWLKHNGVVKGEVVEFSESPVASIPYRPIVWENAREVELHDRIVQATQQYVRTADAALLPIIEKNLEKLFYEQD